MYDLPLATTRRECLSRQKGRIIQKNCIPLATPRRECLCIGDPSVRVSLEAKRAAHSEKGVPLATSRRECLWEFFTTSHWQPLDECASRGRKGGSFRKTVLHGRLPGKNASGKVFLRQQVLCMTSHWRPLGESASRGRKGDSPRKTASHWRLPSESASGKVFLRQHVLCTTSHWRPLGVSGNTTCHWRLPSESASGKVFLRQHVLCMTSHWRPLGESASQGRQGGSFRKKASHWGLPGESASGKVFCPAKGSICMAIRKSIPRPTHKPPGVYRGGEGSHHFIIIFIIYICIIYKQYIVCFW